ncbi:hypothetical protein [Aquimarina aggregata]|nr:hypothetical protein [Aquimarina aggregata]
MKKLFKIKSSISMIMIATLLLCFSCSKEDESIPENNAEIETEDIALQPKTLATIEFSNDVEITFKSEEDGVIFEATGHPDTFKGLGDLENLSILGKFLALTNDNVLVPEDLVLLEDNQKLKSEALKRGTNQKHITKINAKLSLSDLKAPANPAHCSGSPGYYSTDAFGQYYRTYKNYLAGGNGTTIYSSWKSGGNKCKEVKLWLSNCSNNKTLKARTYYKNAFNNYKHRHTVNIAPNTARFWSKGYLSKRYRKTTVSATGQAGHRFGGYLLFTNY